MVQSKPRTIAEFLARAVSTRSSEDAIGFISNGELHWRTWREVWNAAWALTAELQAAGVAAGDRVAQVSENRYEWVITDLALHLIGAVHVPIHVTLSGQQIAEQIRDSGAKVVFASDGERLANFANQLPENTICRLHDEQGERLNALLDKSATADLKKPAVAPEYVPRIAEPDQLATILYTSGTTGRPRGVMLSHANLASNAAAVCEAHGVDCDHTMLCILPLSHIYARTCDLYTWVVSGSRLVLAESRETLLRDCRLVRPTALNAVPFVYQRVMEGTCSNSPASDHAAALRAVFGGEIEQLFCGGAPVGADVERWYAENDLPLLPGYGLTEASPVISVSTADACRLGTVGRTIPGVELRIANDGELQVRGPNVMLGYWHDDVATAEAISDGWLHTGDLAELDEDGFLYIRGRKKELIVLSTGKKVSPTRVEALLTASPLIHEAAVFGDGNCGLVALIVAAENVGDARSDVERTGRFASEIGRCLAGAAHEEQIHCFAILDRAFSIERGELTAKMSMCRNVIAQNFAAELAELQPQRSQSPQRVEPNKIAL
jgi:long-chain acyl-CoA synthetase